MPGGRLGEIGSRFVANPQLMVDQDLRNFKAIMEGTATPEEIQQRIAAAQSGMVAFLTSGAGLLVLGGALLLVLLLRRRSKKIPTAPCPGTRRGRFGSRHSSLETSR